jgi:putative peptidoglycan lipid II flippase
LVVQALGIVRELFVASQVGISSRLDALLIALILPTSLASLLTNGMVTALVPAYLGARKAGGREDARRLAGAVLTWVALAGLALSAVLAALAGLAIALAGPGLSQIDRENAISYLQILAPIAFVASFSSILYAVFQAEERFSAIAVSTMVGSVVTLAIVLFGWQSMGLHALAVGSLVGPVVSLLILLGASARGSAMPRPGLRAAGLDVRGLMSHAAPLTLGAALLQINMIVDRAIASLLAPGAVSALRFAEVLIRTPISAINPAWSSAIYPTLVHMAQGRPGSLAGVTDRLLRFALAAFVPVAILTVAVAPVAVSVAFGRGAYTARDLALTTTVAVGFAPLVVVLMTSPVIRLALNARRMGQVLLFGAALNVILNTVFDIVLGLWLGVQGVALSSSLTAGAVAIFFARRLAGSDPDFSLRPSLRTLLLAATASTPGAIPLAALSWSGTYPSETIPGVLVLIVFGVIGVTSYVAVASWIGLGEPRALVRLILGRFSRMRGGSELSA